MRMSWAAVTLTQWHATDGLTPTVFTIGILVDIVSQVNDVVNAVFSCGIAEGVEESKGEVAA